MPETGRALVGVEAPEASAGEPPVTPTLELRSWLRPAAALGLMTIVPALITVVPHVINQTPLGLADGIFAGFMGALALLALVASLFPVVLRADAIGIHWRQFGWRKSLPWNEIESIGIGRDRTLEGYDHPVARIMAPQAANFRRPPSIGINLKLGDRNAATVSYRRGFTGYELNFHHVFNTSLVTLMADLQARLEAARQSSGDVNP